MCVDRRRHRPSNSLCADCGVPTWPFETYMVADAVWEQARGGHRCLCVACLENRLDRALEREDFPPLVVNDDSELDSVRLRLRKGSGRCVEPMYALAQHAVADLGVGLDLAAMTLGLDCALLATWVENGRVREEAMRAA
jgi:hypothetical protein